MPLDYTPTFEETAVISLPDNIRLDDCDRQHAFHKMKVRQRAKTPFRQRSFWRQAASIINGAGWPAFPMSYSMAAHLRKPLFTQQLGINLGK